MKRIGTLCVIAMLLGACSGRERATMTGSYGSGVVTGEAVLSEGGSVAGVEVSVSGTGMSSRLAADGKFAFAGVPEGAELLFERASDGIAETVKLDSANAHVTVDLSKKSGGRRRAVGPSKEYQFEGLVVSATDAQIVMTTSREQVTIALTAQTVIRRGNTPVLAADLTAGQRVHVKATRSGDTFTASQVIVQGKNDDDDDSGDDDGPNVREYEGTVVSASATQLVLNSSKKVEETFVLNAETDIRKGNTPVAAADIQAGWRVHVKATAPADGATKTAVRVIVQNTNSR